VERREAVEISARKKSIIAILGNVAELGASRMEEILVSPAPVSLPTGSFLRCCRWPEIDCFFRPRFAVSFGSSLAFFI
jgi:hypothetical protein